MPHEATRIALLLAVFAIAFLLAQLALDSAWRSRLRGRAINLRLKLIGQGTSREQIVRQLRKNAPASFDYLPPLIARQLRAVQRLFFAASLPVTPQQGLLAMVTLFALVLSGLAILASVAGLSFTAGIALLILVVAVAAAIVVPLMIISILAQRRRSRIEQQFPIALDVFVRALRSGHPVASAIDLLTHEMEDPIGSEFGMVSDEIAYGADLADALDSMADRWNLEDMRMFVVSLSVQTETGGNLAEILENLSIVIRARASMYRKVRALSAEGRMTGWMLTALPVFTFVSMFLVNPKFYFEVALDPIFLIGFPALMLLYFIGLITIRQMVNLKV